MNLTESSHSFESSTPSEEKSESENNEESSDSEFYYLSKNNHFELKLLAIIHQIKLPSYQPIALDEPFIPPMA